MRSEELNEIGTIHYLEKKRISNKGSGPLFWSITSGKGGVGRSFYTSSLGITLSRLGYRVLMVDADPQGGNLHTFMGVLEKNKTIADYFNGTDPLKSYFHNLGFEKLSLLAGDICLWDRLGMPQRNMVDLLSDLRKQSFDIILFDLAPGVNEETREILGQSDEIFLLTTPEACSIEKTYRWLESYIMKMQLAPADGQALSDFNQIRKKERRGPLESLFMVREFLASLQFKRTSERKTFGPIKLIVNQTRSFEDERLGDLIKSVCNKFYFTEVDMAGWLQFDNAVWQCARQRVPLLINQPFNPLAGQIQGLVKHLVDHTSERTVV